MFRVLFIQDVAERRTHPSEGWVDVAFLVREMMFEEFAHVLDFALDASPFGFERKITSPGEVQQPGQRPAQPLMRHGIEVHLKGGERPQPRQAARMCAIARGRARRLG
jgi:hypothetical protein